MEALEEDLLVAVLMEAMVEVEVVIQIQTRLAEYLAVEKVEEQDINLVEVEYMQ